jgi:hypothetical protein
MASSPEIGYMVQLRAAVGMGRKNISHSKRLIIGSRGSVVSAESFEN